MAVFHDIHNLPVFNNAVITIGTFDGVHKGHSAILQQVARHAEAVGGESMLITFDPHPRKLLFPHQQLGIITPLHQKLELVAKEGIQHTVVVPFTRQFADFTAREYITNFLAGLFRPHSIVVGYDHRYGHDRLGDMDLLKAHSPALGYQVIEIPAQQIADAAVSSTRIRRALEEGQVDVAASMLGRCYTLTGTVVHGNKLGRTIGYPTANLLPLDPEQLIPGNGIYAIRATCHGNTYDGMLSIGYNPTVTDKKELRIEANLFNFDKDIYGAPLTLTFIKKLRDEQKFGSLEELTTQIDRDKTDSMIAIAAMKKADELQ